MTNVIKKARARKNMSMKCDRCGEVFNPEPPDEMGRHKPNAVILVDKNVHDAWDYTHSENLPVNPLYCEGQKRVGCIGCPIAGREGRQREFMRWPAYEKMYISAFERMLDARKAKGLPCDWQTGMDVFRWWMGDDNVSGQLSMDDLMEDNNV